MEKKDKNVFLKIMLIIISIYIAGFFIVMGGGVDEKLYGVVPEWFTNILIRFIYFIPLQLKEIIETTMQPSNEGSQGQL
tara:strand:+ start:61 stop:297 length:237 start_codon:yes stop_codon:yes gene_type:complete